MNHIHPTAQVEEGATVDASARVWHFCHIRKGAVIEPLVSLARDVYVDTGVRVSRGTRVQNGVSLYQGLEIGPWCFIGPHAIFTNDPYPRAGKKGWEVKSTRLGPGMSIGAGSVVRCGHSIGAFALLGAGAIVTKDIAPFHLAIGFPAVEVKAICACGDTQLPLGAEKEELIRACCREKLLPEMLALAEQSLSTYRPLLAS